MDDSGAPKKNMRLILEQIPTIFTFTECSSQGKRPTDDRMIIQIRAIKYNNLSFGTVPGGLADGNRAEFTLREDSVRAFLSASV